MTAKVEKKRLPFPRFARAAVVLLSTVIAVVLAGAVIGMRAGTLVPMAVAAAVGVIAGVASGHGRPRGSEPPLARNANMCSASLNASKIGAGRVPHLDAPPFGVGPPEPPHMTGTEQRAITHRRTSLAIGELGHYKELFGILRGQVENVSVETEGAALNILTRLNEIDRLIQDMIGFLGRAGSSDMLVDLMDRTESRLAANRRLLDAFRTSRHDAAVESQQHLGEVQEMVVELNRVVGQVRTISKQTNMLSFNATIEATRAGEFGKGFAVVASEVKQLSRDSDKAAVDIQGGILRLQEAISAGMVTTVHRRLDAERKGFVDLSASMSQLTEDLEQIIRHQRDVLTKIQESSEMIARPIIALIGSIQFQDITRQQLQHVANGMDFVATHSGQLCEVLEDGGTDQALESTETAITELMAHYVMSQQRNIHSAAIGGDAVEEKGPLVQLF